MLNKMNKGKQGNDAGRVRVYVRVRPLARDDLVGLKEREKENGYEVKPEFNQIKVCGTKQAKDKYYKFDKVFAGGATNSEVFNAVGRPFVQAAVSGFNGTLFAYGQTGSGKTYSLMAPDGMLACVVNRLFARIANDKAHSYKVICAYMQIYQEKIYDLLNSNPKFDLFIREDPKLGIYVENLSHYVCHSPLDVFELVRIGRKRLVFAETRMNRQSSRSHSVCQLTVERTKAIDIKGDQKPNNDLSRPVSCSSPIQSLSDLARVSKPSQESNLQRGRISPRKLVGSDLSLQPIRSVGLPISRRKSNSSGNLALNRKHSQIPVNHELASQRRRSAILSGSSNGLRTPDAKDGQDVFWIEESPTAENGFRPGSAASLISEPCSETDSVMDEYELNMLNMSVPDVSQVKNGWSLDGEPDDFPDENEETNDVFMREGDVVLRGKINICDLAGSERIKKTHAEGDRLSEAQHINLSLLELGNVVAALAEGKRGHIPYRNSALTRLLQDSLGGNCKTSFLLCISPNMRDINETKCTLDFGQRALKVSTSPRMNVEVDYKRLAEELERKLELKETECRTHTEDFERTISTLRNQLREEMEEKTEELNEAHRREVEALKCLSSNLEMKLKLERERSASKELAKARSILITELMSLLLLSQLSELKDQINNDEHDENDPNDLPFNHVFLNGQERRLQPEDRNPSEDPLEDHSFSSGYDTASRPSQESSVDEAEMKIFQQYAPHVNLKSRRPLSLSSESSCGGTVRPCSPLLDKIRSPYMSRKNSLLEELLVENQFHLNQRESLLKSMTARERIEALQRDVSRTNLTITNELRSFVVTQFPSVDFKGLENISKKHLYSCFAHHLMENEKQYHIEQLDQALNLVSVDHILTGCLLALEERKDIKRRVSNPTPCDGAAEEEKSGSLDGLQRRSFIDRDEEPDGESKHSESNFCPIAQIEPDYEEETEVLVTEKTKQKKRKSKFGRFLCMPLRSSKRQKNKHR